MLDEFDVFVDEQMQELKKVYKYAESYRVLNRLRYGESIDSHTLLTMLFMKEIDEEKFGINIKMVVYTKNIFGKLYLRQSLIINGDQEIFFSINTSDIKSISDLSAAFMCSSFYINNYNHYGNELEVNELTSRVNSIGKDILMKTKVYQESLGESYLVRSLIKENEVLSTANRELYFNQKVEKKTKLKNNYETKVPVCYLMVDSHTNYVKIGFSISPDKRERTLQSEKPTIKLLHIFSENHERHLHNKYKQKRVRGEWFNLTEKEVNHIIKNYK